MEEGTSLWGCHLYPEFWVSLVFSSSDGCPCRIQEKVTLGMFLGGDGRGLEGLSVRESETVFTFVSVCYKQILPSCVLCCCLLEEEALAHNERGRALEARTATTCSQS